MIGKSRFWGGVNPFAVMTIQAIRKERRDHWFDKRAQAAVEGRK